VLPMPFSTSQQRLALRNELIQAYNPSCQTPICQTNAGRNQLAEPSARRRIGFVA
jgi:hypothetical protein